MSKQLALVASVFVYAIGTTTGFSQDAQRPNIVLVMADDQGWGETGYNGHPQLKTPTLDEMAHSGLRLNRFYSAHVNCSPRVQVY